MEAEDQYFTMQRLERQQSLGDALPVFVGLVSLKRRGTVGGHIEGPAVFPGFAHRFQAAHGSLAAHVDDQVAGDGEQPCIETGLAIELVASLQYTHPGLLEDVFRSLPVAGEVEQVAQQAMLVLDDQLIEQLGIVALQPLGDEGVLVAG